MAITVCDDVTSEVDAAHPSRSKKGTRCRTTKSHTKKSQCGTVAFISSEKMKLIKERVALKVEQLFHEEETEILLEKIRLAQWSKELSRKKEMAAKAEQQRVQTEKELSHKEEMAAKIVQQEKSDKQLEESNKQHVESNKQHKESNKQLKESKTQEEESNKSVSGNRAPTESNIQLSYPPATEEVAPAQVAKVLEKNSVDECTGKEPLPVKDDKCLEILGDVNKCPDGQNVVPLPFREKQVSLPCNQHPVEKGWRQLNDGSNRNETFAADDVERLEKAGDVECMEKVVRPCAGRAPITSIPGRANRALKADVHNPKKEDGVRVMFDSNAKFERVLLNDVTNRSPRVRRKFGHKDVVFVADVKNTVHQLEVRKRDMLRFLWWEVSDLLQFLWWEDGNLDKMHLFEAKSSPGCTNFGLKWQQRQSSLMDQAIKPVVLVRNDKDGQKIDAGDQGIPHQGAKIDEQ